MNNEYRYSNDVWIVERNEDGFITKIRNLMYLTSTEAGDIIAADWDIWDVDDSEYFAIRPDEVFDFFEENPHFKSKLHVLVGEECYPSLRRLSEMLYAECHAEV